MLTRTQVPLEHCLLSSVCFLMYKGSKIKEPIVSPVMGVPKGKPGRARRARRPPGRVCGTAGALESAGSTGRLDRWISEK